MASGYVMGACYEYQRRYVNIYMMFCCLLGVVASLSIPWCTTVIQLALCYLGIGYTGGSLHAGRVTKQKINVVLLLIVLRDIETF